MDIIALCTPLKELVMQAGKALPLSRAAYTANTLEIDDKAGKANYVTQYDKQTQDFLLAGCKKLVPDAVLIGEESFGTGERLPDAAEFARSFVIDPIDGTTNFIRDFRHSCISLAYLENGVGKIGVIYNPWQDECFFAVRDHGAFVVQSGQPAVRLHTASTPLSHCLLEFGSSPYYPDLQKKTFSILQGLFPLVADIRRSGSAALDLAYVAAGRADAFFEMRLSPWDYAAGQLLVEEAGGRATRLSGEPLLYDRACSVLACSNRLYPILLEKTNLLA